MAKFSGVLGVLTGYDLVNSVATPKIEKFKIYGDVTNSSYRNNSGEKINDDLSISNRFSFIAPAGLITIFADESHNKNNQMAMYIEYFNIKLKVTDVSFQLPRVTMNVGGLWNE